MKNIRWAGAVALLGALLFGAGSSLVRAEVLGDELLPSILKQLQQEGKMVKSTAVLNGGSEAVITITLANGEVRKYNQEGQMTQSVDAYGRLTIYKDGLPTEERDSKGAVLSKTEYIRENGQLKKSVTQKAGGTQETKIYDQAGNVVQSNDSQGSRAYSNYIKDGRGRTLSYQEMDMTNNRMNTVILDPATGETQARIDENGNRTTIENHRDQTGEIASAVERDTAGNVTVKKFEKGQMTEMNRNGVVTKIENVAGPSGRLLETRETTTMATSKGTMIETVVKKYDEAGRVASMVDRDGEHHYTYSLREDGRLATRKEKLSPKSGRNQLREIVTTYDEAGRVVGLNEGAQRTAIKYTVDSKGGVLAAVETKTLTVNGRTQTEVTKKQYDGRGRMVSTTDGAGKLTTYEYDAQGNRTAVNAPTGRTTFTYDQANLLVASYARDKRSLTITNFEKDGKTPSRKVRVFNSGVVETTQYSTSGSDRIALTREAFGLRRTVLMSSESEKPKDSVLVKNNGKVTTTKYEYSGDRMVSSREVGPQEVTETRYNINEKPESSKKTDKWGRQFTTEYQYVGGKMTHSVQTDKKGKTSTDYDEDENPAKITRDSVVGFPRHSVETRQYVQGDLKQSVSTDVKGKSVTKFDKLGLAAEVRRTNIHGFPRENTVKNTYDAGGDLKASVQTDKKGKTNNLFDSDGLMTQSVRVDIYGFPKKKTTHYQYNRGEMVTSQTDDDRGTTNSKYDQDGLMSESRRIKTVGFPREEKTTYSYDGNGYMSKSREIDHNGVTQSLYNQDELVAVSNRENDYGHARKQMTTFSYDGEGFMTTSLEKDLKGETDAKYDQDGQTTMTTRNDHFGLEYGHKTVTMNEFDGNGFMTVSHSKNLLGTTDSNYDKDNLVRKTVQKDNYGLLWGREKITAGYRYDGEGRIQESTEKDRLGITASQYDIHGDAVATKRSSTVGILSSRETVTKSTFHSDTGMTTGSVSKNLYGVTVSEDFDPISGLAKRQIATNNFGLEFTRRTISDLRQDPRHGLTHKTIAKNAYGITETDYDTEKGGDLGVAVSSNATSFFGLGATRKSLTEMESDPNTGLNTHTVSTNEYGTTETEFDTAMGGLYGVAVKSTLNNNFGLGATQKTVTDIDSDVMNGLNKKTVAVNAYGVTTTEYDAANDGTHGVATHSKSDNFFGLGSTLHTETAIASDIRNGLSKKTIAKNAYGVTTTEYDSAGGGTYGVAARTLSENWFGLGATLKTATRITSNTFNGLSQSTVAKNAYGETVTKYDDKKTGVAVSSYVHTKYGLGATQETNTSITSNTYNGLSRETTAKNAYGDTVTKYDDKNTGVAVSSHAVARFGLGATQETDTSIQSNPFNGLSRETTAKNAYGSTTTKYDDRKTGVALSSHATSNFGLGATQETDTSIKSNTYNGLSQQTTATNAYGSTVTNYDDQRTGVALSSHATSNFGLGATKATNTSIKSNTYNGLSQQTTATNAYGSTVTNYDDQRTGVAVLSHATSNYGLGATQVTETNILSNTYTGLSRETTARNAYGSTITRYDDQRTGVAVSSYATSNYGLGATQATNTSIRSNTYTGLSQQTTATNAYGSTVTNYDDQRTGVAVSSHAVSNYGLGATRVTNTNIRSNLYNGLSQETTATNAYGSTITRYDDQRTGVAVSSYATSNYGLGATRATNTSIRSNPYTGLSQQTTATNAYGSTVTNYDDQRTGVAMSSHATSHYGLGATQETNTSIRSNTYTGLSQQTTATNAYGSTVTNYDDQHTGVATSSHAVSNYGLGATRATNTSIQSETHAGLSRQTTATNAYGSTVTNYDDQWTGVAVSSHAKSNYGIGSTRVTDTSIRSNTYNGLSQETTARNAYGVTITNYDDQSSGVATSSYAVSNYGIGATRATHTSIVSNRYNGLSQQTTATNGYGVTVTNYDSQSTGVAVSSYSVSNFGIGATRTTNTSISSNTFNGLTRETTARNAYGVTVTRYNDQSTGVAVSSNAVTNYGLGATRNTNTTISTNSFTGVTTRTVSSNGMGTTTTNYDANGLAVSSRSTMNSGPSRSSNTRITTNPYTGLTTHTSESSSSGSTETNYSSAGTPVSSVSRSHGKTTRTSIEVDGFSGVTVKTTASNSDGSTVVTYYNSNYGNATSSITYKNKGPAGERVTYTQINSSTYNGVINSTVATNKAGTTVARFNSKGAVISSKFTKNPNYKATAASTLAGGIMTSAGNKAVGGVVSGGSAPAGQAKAIPQAATQTVAQPASASGKAIPVASVQAAPVASAASVVPAGIVTAASVSAPASGSAKSAPAKAISQISAQEVVDFATTVISKLNGAATVAALKDSAGGMAVLIKRVGAIYQSMFGEGYNASALGQVVKAINQAAKLEPVRLVLPGTASISSEMKLAAEREREFKDAQRVTRDEKGNIIQAIDKAGAQHDFVYDESGMTETVADQKGKVSVKHKDNSGRLLSENSEGRSVVYTYEFDGQGKVTQTTAQERTAQGATTLKYNQQGLLVSIDGSNGQQTITYEGPAEDKVMKSTTCDVQGKVQVQKIYKGGKLAEVRNQDGSVMKYEYITDAAGKVAATTVEVTNKDNKKALLKYNAEGRLVSALGKDANRFEKMAKPDSMAEQAFGFELDKSLRGDARIEGFRISQKQVLKQVQAAPAAK